MRPWFQLDGLLACYATTVVYDFCNEHEIHLEAILYIGEVSKNKNNFQF